MKGAAPKGKQISGSPENKIGFLSPPVIGMTGLGIAALACNLAVSAQEQKSIQENIFSAKSLRVFSSTDTNLSPADQTVLASYNVGVQKVLEGASSLGLVELPGDTTIYQYEGINQQGEKSKVEFAVSSVLIADKLGSQVVAPEAIISFRNDDVVPVSGQVDSSVKSFVLDGSHVTEDVGNTTLVTLKTLAAPGEESRVLAVLLFDKADQGQSLDQLLKDKSKFKELTLCNLVTNKCIVAPSSGVNPTLPPTQDMSSNLDLLLFQVTDPLIKVLQSGSSAAPTAEVPPTTAGPTAGTTSTAETAAPAVPMIEVTDVKGNKVSVPDILKIVNDPKLSKELDNAEMIKIYNTSVRQYVNIFVQQNSGEADEAFEDRKQAFTQKTTAGLKTEIETDIDGNQFVVVTSPEGYYLLTTNSELQWGSTFKDYAHKVNIPTGVYLEPGKNNYLIDIAAKQNFDDIVLPIFWHNIFKGSENGNFALPDSMVTLAGSEMGQFGGTLLWQNPDFLPKWFKDGKVTEEQVRSMIKSIIQKYPDVKVWIPVNEPYSTDFFANRLGYPGYVVTAFDEARKNTDVPLILNDFDIEKTGSSKYNKTKALVETLKAQNLIDGIGIQMHIDPNNPPTKEALKKNFESWGIDVYLTELDIPTENEELKAKIFSDVFSAAIESGVVKQVNVWGLGTAAWKQNGNLFDSLAQPTRALFEVEKTIIEHLSSSSSQ